MSYRITTDSTCDMPREFYTEHSIPCVGLGFQINGKEYREGSEDCMPIHDFYEALRGGAQSTTMQVNTYDFIDFVEPYLQAGEDVQAFKDGLQLADGLSCLPAVLIPLGAGRSAVRVQEGKFHQVRRMMAARGLPLFYLKRVAEGGLWLESLAPGAVLELDMGETERRITSPCDFDEKKLLANCVRNSQPFGGNDEKL